MAFAIIGPAPGSDSGDSNHRVSFNTKCVECGSLCCYVDDSTYTFASPDPALLSSKLTEQYRLLADYMANNKLVINDDKTHLLVMGTRKHAALRKQVYVDTGTVRVIPVSKVGRAYYSK